MRASLLVLLCLVPLALSSEVTSNSRKLLMAATSTSISTPLTSSITFAASSTRTLDNTDLAGCTCDLTANMCDAAARCSCDPDCTAADIARFAAASAPTPASYLFNPPSLPNGSYCVSSDVATYNTRGDLSVSILSNLLCVSTVNNPSTALFLNGVTSMSSAQVASALSSQANSLRTFEKPAIVASTPSNAGVSYKNMDRIGALYTSATVGKVGYLPIPTRGFGTECSDSHFARFNQPFAPSLPCYRVSYDIATLCAASNSVLSPLYWASMLIAPYTGAPAATPSAFLPVTVRSIWQQPVGTTSVTSRVMISNTNLTAPSSGLTVSAPTYSTTGSGCKCSNVLYELDLTLQYSSAGVVTGAFADVVLTDVTAAFTSSPSCVGAAAVTPQTFSLAFNSSSSSAAPAARSGAPGYNVGLPVLAGYSVTDPAGTGFSAVLPIASGLTVSGASTAGQCSTDSSQRLPVTFGSDMLAVCQVPLTQAQLISRCQSVSLGSSATAAGVGLWEYMTLNATSIGMFGNSVPSNAADWVTITQASPVSSMTWNAATHSCDGVATATNIEIFYSLAGSTLTPQAVITAATISYTYTTVYLEQGATTTSVPLAASVSFIYVPSSSLTQYLPPVPPSLPQMPADVLYPLYIGAAPANSLSLGAVGAIVSLWLLAVFSA